MVRFNPTNKNFKSIIGGMREDQPFELAIEINKNINK